MGLSNEQNDLNMLRSPKQVQERQLRKARRRLRLDDRRDRQQQSIDPYPNWRGMEERQERQNQSRDHVQEAPKVEPKVNGGSKGRNKWIQLDLGGKVVEEGARPKKMNKLKTTKGIKTKGSNGTKNKTDVKGTAKQVIGNLSRDQDLGPDLGPTLRANKEEKVGGLWRYLKRKRDEEGPRMLVRGGQMGQGIKGGIVGKTLGTGERSNSLGDQRGGDKWTSTGQESFN